MKNFFILFCIFMTVGLTSAKAQDVVDKDFAYVTIQRITCHHQNHIVVHVMAVLKLTRNNNGRIIDIALYSVRAVKLEDAGSGITAYIPFDQVIKSYTYTEDWMSYYITFQYDLGCGGSSSGIGIVLKNNFILQ